jgi:hypothetical protein
MTLPQFLIVGAPRCGTTFLSKNLQLHPEIFMPRRDTELGSDDLHFFDLHTNKGRTNYRKGIAWYEELFSECKRNQLPGEKTADYLGSEQSSELILDALGSQTKIIVLIRDPIQRAYSHYIHSRHRLPMGLSFSEMVESLTDPEDIPVLSSGLYYHHLRSYLKNFGAHNVFVVVSDDLDHNPQGELSRICRFLGVSDDYAFNLANARVNQSSAGIVSHLSARVGLWMNHNSPSLYNWILNGTVSGFARKLILNVRGKSVEYGGIRDRRKAGFKDEDLVLLKNYYRKDVNDLSSFLDRDLSNLWWG